MERWFCRYAMPFMSIILSISSVSLFKDSSKFWVRCFFCLKSSLSCCLFIVLAYSVLQDTCYALQFPSCFINLMMQYNYHYWGFAFDEVELR
jgi:hypothetical protein